MTTKIPTTFRIMAPLVGLGAFVTGALLTGAAVGAGVTGASETVGATGALETVGATGAIVSGTDAQGS
jgi:hypothetical protein